MCLQIFFFIFRTLSVWIICRIILIRVGGFAAHVIFYHLFSITLSIPEYFVSLNQKRLTKIRNSFVKTVLPHKTTTDCKTPKNDYILYVEKFKAL